MIILANFMIAIVSNVFTENYESSAYLDILYRVGLIIDYDRIFQPKQPDVLLEIVA